MKSENRIKGKVYIVGAGPGDIGLLTLKGLRCLQKAEVVVYDFHLNAQILNYIKHDAEFIYAGKRGGHHTMTQDEINRSLVARAKEGKIVCRLKGGDPFVFGRGGEEAVVLADEGIEFEVIPGISSAIAAPAYAGIPLTHREYSSSFTVIAGNKAAAKSDSAVDCSKFVDIFDTLVFLMGIKNISAIVSNLMECGKSPDTPVAVIMWGSRPDQKTVTGKLKDIVDLVKNNDIKPPAVMVVGEVVRLREKLAWYESKPLFGHRILITRKYTEDYIPLEESGAEIFEFLTIETVPPDDYSKLDNSIEQIDKYDWLIFTSSNGFKFFISRLIERNKDIRDLKGINICAIGPKTARTARDYGIKVDIIPDEFNAEGLIKVFQGARGKGQGAKGLENVRLLLPRAEAAREIFPDKVRELGGEIDTPVAYRTINPETHAKRLIRFIKEGRITVATFTSAATFNNFLKIVDKDAKGLLRDVAIAVIGPVTRRAVEKAGLKVDIMPARATINDMVASIIDWATKNKR